MKQTPRHTFPQALTTLIPIIVLLTLLARPTLQKQASSTPIKLTTQKYNKFISTNRYCFVYFYTQNCKECIPFDVQFSRLAKQYSNMSMNSSILNGTEVYFGKVDGSQEKKLMEQYNVKQFPALFFIDQTFVVKYEGESGKSQMFSWIEKYMGNRVLYLGDNVQMLNKIHTPYVLLEDSQQLEQAIVNKAVYNLINPAIKTYKIKTAQHSNIPSSQIKLKVVFKNRTVSYPGKTERIQIKKWLESVLKNSISPVNTKQQTERVMFNEKLPGLLFIIPNSQIQHPNYELFAQTCDLYIGKLSCGYIFESYSSFKGAHSYFKQKDPNTPIISLVTKSMNIAYKMNMPFNKINKQSLIEFIDSCLEDRHQRTVDNVVPDKIVFNSVKLLGEQELEILIKEQKYVFINFFDGKDEGSLYFSRVYEVFASNLGNQEKYNMTVIAAVDCGNGGQKCTRKFQYFPYLALYINGIEVPYEKTPKVPQIPELSRFLSKKLQRKYQQYSQDKQKSYKTPYIVLQSSQISKQLQALPALMSSLPFYHKKPSKNSPDRLYLQIYNDESQDFPAPSSKESLAAEYTNWLKQQTQNVLVDVLAETQHQKIRNAVKNKQPILVLLDFDKDNSREYRARLGLIAKKFGICGVYAESTNKMYRQFYDWFRIQNNQMKDQARIIYSQTDREDIRFVYYAKSVEQVTFEGMSRFLERIKKFDFSKTAKLQRQDSQRPKIQNQEL